MPEQYLNWLPGETFKFELLLKSPVCLLNCIMKILLGRDRVHEQLGTFGIVVVNLSLILLVTIKFL